MALNLNELQELLNNASSSAANEKEVRKSLTRIENLIGNVSKELEHVYSILDGAEVATKPRKQRAETVRDEEAPYGRKKDGTPKARPGRTKEHAE